MTDETAETPAAQIERLEHALSRERTVSADWKAHARKWEDRAKRSDEDINEIVKKRIARIQDQVQEARSDRDAFSRSARLWEDRAKTNLAVIRAHEGTIAKFIERLDDVLAEED